MKDFNEFVNERKGKGGRRFDEPEVAARPVVKPEPSPFAGGKRVRVNFLVETDDDIIEKPTIGVAIPAEDAPGYYDVKTIYGVQRFAEKDVEDAEL